MFHEKMGLGEYFGKTKLKLKKFKKSYGIGEI